MEQVILVNESDEAIGTMDKLEAHLKGALHRAFSILLFNSRGEVLLQKRSWKKYHSPGLWTNTCCSHPGPGETLETATTRKLAQEMGITADIDFAYKFTYKVNLENGLIEHECDHVFVGKFEGVPIINLEEVEDWRFAPIDQLRKDVLATPGLYTQWFRLILGHRELMQAVA